MDPSSIPYLLMFLNNKNDKDNSSNYLQYIIFLVLFLPKIIPLYIISDFIENFLKKESKIEVKLISDEVNVVRSCSAALVTKTVYSNNFVSVSHYLSKKRCELKNLTEVMVNNTELNLNRYDDDSSANEWNKRNQYLFFPVGQEEFVIFQKNEKDDKYKIFCHFKDSEISTEDNDDKNKNKNTVSKKKKFTITLSIKSKNPNDINKILAFIEECNIEYHKDIDKKLNDDTQNIYVYMKSEKEDDKMNLIFKEYPLKNNKYLGKNIFFKDIEKMVNYIKDFIYDPDLPDDKMSPGEDRYVRCGFTYKAGLLFHGTPGCGKTSAIKAILNETKRHAIIINLNRIKTCEELENVFRTRTINGKKLKGKQICYILEDCDAFEDNIIKSRKLNEDKKGDNQSSNDNSSNNKFTDLDENINSNKLMEYMKESNIKSDYFKSMIKVDDAVNLSCFLNILDGLIELYGVMIIMTTNYPKKIDDALIRPGRIDFIYEFTKATKKTIIDMLKISYDLTDIQIEKYVKHLNIKDEVLSPAEVQSICFKNNDIQQCINELILAAQKSN